MNHSDIFSHIANLKIVILAMDYTRPGTDFFQSLTDGHPEILQVTGQFYFYRFWDSTITKDNLEELIDEFIYHPQHMQLFDSRFNLSERWNKLGVNKNEHFEVSIQKFRYHLIKMMTGRELSSRNLFYAIHGAYALSRGIDVMKTKLLFNHIHHVKRCERMKKDFPNFKLIIMSRDLRDGLVSYIEHRPKSASNYYSPRTYLQPLRSWSSIFYYVKRFDEVIFISLKDLHQNHDSILKNFCDDLNIKFIPEILFKSNYHGKLWWGDRWSKFMNGFNPEFGKDKEKKWQGKLSLLDNSIIEFLFWEQINIFNYPYKINIYNIYYVIIPILILIPMKYEIKILLYNINTNKRSYIKTIILCLISYYYRTKYYYQVYIKKLFKINIVNISKY